MVEKCTLSLDMYESHCREQCCVYLYMSSLSIWLYVVLSERKSGSCWNSKSTISKTWYVSNVNRMMIMHLVGCFIWQRFWLLWYHIDREYSVASQSMSILFFVSVVPQKTSSRGKVKPVDHQSRLLTLNVLWANSADDKLMIFFLFFLENRIWHVMQTVS